MTDKPQTESNNQGEENKKVEFERDLIDAIPCIEELGDIELKVTLDYDKTKTFKIYGITYEAIVPSGKKMSPYLDLTVTDKNNSSKTSNIKLRFTSNAKLETLGENIELLGGGFTVYDIKGIGKGKGLALNDDCEGHFEKEVTYQTFSNFDTVPFDKDYLFFDENVNNGTGGKVIIDLTIRGEHVGELWSQNSSTNGQEWMHKVPSYVDSETENRTESYGGKLLITMISNALLRLMASNFNLSDEKRKGSKKENIFIGELPTMEDLKDIRPVDLDAIKLNEHLKDNDLHFRWNTISSICASLNSGKNVILVGPPGCGKTRLAVEVAKYGIKGKKEESAALLCTASPAWTTGDLVGRYLPSPDGQGLIFDEGFFLKAIATNKWLIVDEINRANIDSCFGELFSILSNHRVDLPFKVEVEGDDGEKVYKSVGVVPSTEEKRDKNKDYKVPASFRMIGTMNDADRGQLATLSFALQRRFNTLYMDPPAPDTIEKIVNSHFDEFKKSIWGDKNEYLIKVKNITTKDTSHISSFKEIYTALFGGENGLVSENVIGVSILLDSMKFAFEGLRNEEQQLKVGVNKGGGNNLGTSVNKHTNLTHLRI